MKIQPIVEGHGDAKAVPVLLRRLAGLANPSEAIEINQPIRRQRTQLVSKSALSNVVELARMRNPGAILIMFDGDDNCPATLGPQVQQWAKEVAGNIPCQVVIPHREYEAWFLASIVSLQGVRGIAEDAEPHPNPEGVRGVKEQISARMTRGSRYVPTIHQPSFSDRFSVDTAYNECRSFRKMMGAFAALLRATGHGIHSWSPPFERME